MKNIVLIGGAGAPNYGDELIVRGWMEFLRGEFPDSKITFFENIANKERELHGNSVVFSDHLVKVAKAYGGISFWEQVIRGYNFIDNDGVRKYAQFDLLPLLEADIVHLHGGGYLNNFDPEKGFFIGFSASLSKKFNTKVVGTGIGFGPLPPPPSGLASKIDEIFDCFELFELRDIDNFRMLSAAFSCKKFSYGLDDCYTLSDSQIYRRDNGSSRLYLSYLAYNVENISDDYWKSLNAFSSNFDEILFIESYPWQDAKVFAFLESKVDRIKFISVENAVKGNIFIGENDFAIAARFHVHFIMARAGISGVYMKDSKYYDVKHQSIVDLGSPFYLGNLANLDAVHLKSPSSLIRFYSQGRREAKIGLAKSIYQI